MKTANIVLWHNPKCSTSRNALDRLRDLDIQPEIYLYVSERPSRDRVQALLRKAKLKPSEALRVLGTPAEELGLIGASEEKILDAMAAHPILLERPILSTPKGALIARPIERMDEIL